MKKIITLCIIILAVIGLAGAFFNRDNTPSFKSAEGMTKEERVENDNSILKEELKDVDRIDVRHDDDAIVIYIPYEKSKQNIDEIAANYVDDVKSALIDRKSDLTLEKNSYLIYIYSSDGRLIDSASS
ncbi:hypothetical protein [Bacillus massiliigorillae]|uniref:hypothetical protein n=1 Tax=Bacillus massiliigorillae TaxID=1243664 RepID=UPI00039E883A|nr:hypothetical protein [Bacillus massiliigorillae]